MCIYNISDIVETESIDRIHELKNNQAYLFSTDAYIEGNILLLLHGNKITVTTANLQMNGTLVPGETDSYNILYQINQTDIPPKTNCDILLEELRNLDYYNYSDHLTISDTADPDQFLFAEDNEKIKCIVKQATDEIALKNTLQFDEPDFEMQM